MGGGISSLSFARGGGVWRYVIVVVRGVVFSSLSVVLIYVSKFVDGWWRRFKLWGILVVGDILR